MATLMLPTLHAQLFVSVAPAKTSAQKIVVPLTMNNALPQTIQSARAAVFIIGGDGKVIDQRTQWVIGGDKDKAGLAAGSTNTFHFVIKTDRPMSTTNLTARLSFSRVILQNGKLVDVRKHVHIESIDR